MKKVLLSLILVLAIWNPASAWAAPEHVNSKFYYASYKDEYRVDHTGLPALTFHLFRVNFIAADTTVYNLDFGSYTGILWLTCNGTYLLQFLDTNMDVIAQSNPIKTTQIQNPSCNSYPEQTGQDGLDLQQEPNGSGGYNLEWTPDPSAASYEIWKDGIKVGETTDPNFTLDGPGSVSVIGKDANGDVIAQSDAQVPTYTGQPGWGNGTGCDICKMIRDALECPDWDTYMGELTGAIRDALPTLEGWRDIADQFVDGFADYFGDVPAVPTVGEIAENITPTMPELDTTVADADFNLAVPEGFEQPKIFDVTSGPVISVEDDSEPFEIQEPDAYLDSDQPGVMVFPGDERNSSGGIKNPDTITTEYEQPVPTVTQSPLPGPTIPPSAMPTPSGSAGTAGPVPSSTPGIGPTPAIPTP